MAFSKEFKELLKIWQKSGVWRRFSFEDFVLEIQKILEIKNDKRTNK